MGRGCILFYFTLLIFSNSSQFIPSTFCHSFSLFLYSGEGLYFILFYSSHIFRFLTLYFFDFLSSFLSLFSYYFYIFWFLFRYSFLFLSLSIIISVFFLGRVGGFFSVTFLKFSNSSPIIFPSFCQSLFFFFLFTPLPTAYFFIISFIFLNKFLYFFSSSISLFPPLFFLSFCFLSVKSHLSASYFPSVKIVTFYHLSSFISFQSFILFSPSFPNFFHSLLRFVSLT